MTFKWMPCLCQMTQQSAPKSELNSWRNPLLLCPWSSLLSTNDPQCWFVQEEAQFGICRVSIDKTRHWNVMATLDAKTASHASCTFKSAPSEKCYGVLKAFRLKTFTPSKWQRAQRILVVQELADRCASQVTIYLLRTLENLDPAVLVQYVLLYCLTTHVQVPLPTSDVQDVQQLAEEADRILDLLLSCFSKYQIPLSRH